MGLVEGHLVRAHGPGGVERCQFLRIAERLVVYHVAWFPGCPVSLSTLPLRDDDDKRLHRLAERVRRHRPRRPLQPEQSLPTVVATDIEPANASQGILAL